MKIFPKIFWWYCLLIFQVMCRDPPTVKIEKQGTISGMFMKMYRTQSIVAYLGIPYAHPPIGMMRFSPPVVDELPKWEGTRNGSVSQPNCYQNTNNPPPKHTMVLNKLLSKMDINMTMMDMASDRYDEDCLYLNIFVPDGEFSEVSWNFGNIDFAVFASNCISPSVLSGATQILVIPPFPTTKLTRIYRLAKNSCFRPPEKEAENNKHSSEESFSAAFFRVPHASVHFKVGKNSRKSSKRKNRSEWSEKQSVFT
jgi:hypothetical protein